MHSLVFVKREQYRDSLEKFVAQMASKYSKSCYISFSDPYHIVIQMLENANAHERFIIIDASGNVKAHAAISENVHVAPVENLFNVYLFLRNLLDEEGVKMLLIDSVSSLIYKHNNLPLKEMLANLLLEVGAFGCDSSLVVFDDHSRHEVVQHLSPFIGKSIVL